MNNTTLIVGCGLTGAILAERIATVLHEEVVIIDKRDHVAGNIYDYVDKDTNVLVHKYGPHVFHTSDAEVWHYLSQFTQWHYFLLKVVTLVDGRLAPVPFNMNSLYELFPPVKAHKLEELLLNYYPAGAKLSISELLNNPNEEVAEIANFVMANIFEGYTRKQWGPYAHNLDKSVLARVPINMNRDDRYFTDTYQGVPINGYTAMIETMLASPKEQSNPEIQLLLNTDWRNYKDKAQAKRLIFTGPIDEFYDFRFGKLPYRSLSFDLRRYEDIQDFQQHSHINYPCNYDFTRSIEYCHYLPRKHHGTCVVYEYPQDYQAGVNEPFYPVPEASARQLYEKYASLSEKVIFAGRLGKYKYYNMDVAVRAALDLFAKIEKDQI